MKKKIKYAVILVVVLAIVGVFVFSAMQPLMVATVTITPSHAEMYFTERGHVQDDRHVNVYSMVGGAVLSVAVREGQFIHEGDVIATVDPVDLLHEIEQIRAGNLAIYAQIDNLSVEESQARSSQASARNVLQSELNAINAQEQMARTTELSGQQMRDENIRLQNILIEQSFADLQNALNDLERVQGLYIAGIMTRLEVEANEQVVEALRTAHQVNQQQLEIINNDSITDQSEHFAALRSSIQAQINGINTSLNELSMEPMRRSFYAQIESNNLSIANLERRVANSTIVSPVSGIIENLQIDSINILNPAMPVAEIRTEVENLVEVFVSTANITDLSVGDIVDLIFLRQGGDAVYSGRIYSISDRAEATVSILGVEERRARVLIEPVTPSDSFRSGFDVDVRFITYSANDQMLVPRTAVFEENGQSMVYVATNGTATARPVAVGTQLRTEFVVESGLSVGDVVIRDARQSGLSSGARIAY